MSSSWIDVLPLVVPTTSSPLRRPWTAWDRQERKREGERERERYGTASSPTPSNKEEYFFITVLRFSDLFFFKFVTGITSEVYPCPRPIFCISYPEKEESSISFLETVAASQEHQTGKKGKSFGSCLPSPPPPAWEGMEKGGESCVLSPFLGFFFEM